MSRVILGSIGLALALVGCTPRAHGPLPEASAVDHDALRTVRLLVTTDEHGWLHPWRDAASGEYKGGLLSLAATLKEEGLGQPHVALLSGGDMWTGPYESTLLHGAPMVAAFNALGYSAAAVGNHEFDFGLDTLARRAEEATFPLLAANLRMRATNVRPTFAAPSVLLDVNGVQVGVVGLTHARAFETTDPRNLETLTFLPYEPVLEEEVPALRSAGADIVIVVMHDDTEAAIAIAPTLRRLGVRVVGAGHAHRAQIHVDQGTSPGRDDDITICNGGAYLRTFCRFDVHIAASGQHAADAALIEVSSPHSAPENPWPVLSSIVEDATEHAKRAGGEILARAPQTITRADDALGQLIVDSWLDALPQAQVAITNAGGIRQDLPAGDVRVSDVVSVMPFNNTLFIVELSPDELVEALTSPQSVAGGVRVEFREDASGNREVLSLTDRKGVAFPPDQPIRVVINDFMYRGGDRYRFDRFDDTPEETSVDWRDPVYRALRARTAAGLVVDTKADDRARVVDR